MSTLSISFICRESKANRMGLAPIECSVIYGGRRTFIQLPRKECPDNFRRLMKCRRGNELKDFCLAYYSVVQSAFSFLFCSGVDITPALLKQYLRGEYSVSYTVSQLCKEYLDLLKKRVDCDDLTMQVYFKYERIYRRLIERVGSELPVKELSNGILRDFLTLLKKDYGEATVCGYWTKVKCLIRYAIDNGKLSVNPCAGIKVSRGEKEVEYLTEAEVSRIEGCECHGILRLQRVRDLFIFQCHTGLAYADMSSFCMDDVRECEYGYYVRKERKKTGVFYTVLIDDVALSILRKYDGRLPVLSNQRYNAWLKEIGVLCRIDKPIHTHIARHTCATMLLNRGLSIDVVASVLGHSSTKITKHYAKMIDRTVLGSMAEVLRGGDSTVSP